MKKIFGLLTLIISFAFTLQVSAASASLSVSKGTIENGSTVKASVSVSGAAAWNVKIASSGATSGCTETFADASTNGKNTSKTFSVTCRATSTGIINFSLSGDITSEDGSNTKVSGNKSVTVVVPRAKSANNNLNSLSIEGFEISPEFSKDVLEYSLTVPSTTNTIKINAKAADSYASLDGTGEKTVEEGVNTFLIVVTSETGVEKTYKINVTVKDENPIEVILDGNSYTIVKNRKNLEKPEFFEETTITIDDIEIPAYYNETIKYTLVGLKDEAGNIIYSQYKDGKYYKYNLIVASGISLIITETNDNLSNYKSEIVTIEENKVTALVSSVKSDFIVLHGVNLVNNKEGFYSYDKIDKTLQRLDLDMINSLNISLKDKTNLIKLGIIAIPTIIIFFSIIIVLMNSKAKKTAKLNELNEKISKKKKKELKESNE